MAFGDGGCFPTVNNYRSVFAVALCYNAVGSNVALLCGNVSAADGDIAAAAIISAAYSCAIVLAGRCQ